jgi:hypothetical protein
MTAVSQWEREAIGERTRDALCHKRRRGERVGNIPFGSRLAGDGQHLEADPGEQATLAEIATLRKQDVSMRRIAAVLNQRAYRTRRGTPWRLESVARVLNHYRPPVVPFPAPNSAVERACAPATAILRGFRAQTFSGSDGFEGFRTRPGTSLTL